MKLSEYSRYDGAGLAELVRKREVTVKELVRLALEGVEKVNPQLNAIVETYDNVLENINEGSIPNGPFKGVPFLRKDLGATEKGCLQERGSRLMKGYICESDSNLWKKFTAAGLINIGRTAVPEAEVVYRYRAMRGLHIVSTRNIGQAIPAERSVQLRDVQQDASLCIRAEVQILYTRPDGSRLLRNGPFHRKFLDGYFPFHVRLEVRYPPGALRYLGASPEPQAGFAVDSSEGRVTIDSWFAGTLNIEIGFAPLQTGTASGR